MSSEAKIGKGTLLQRYYNAGWITIAEQVTIGGPSTDTDDIEVTNHDSPNYAKEFIPGLYDPGEISFEGNFLPGNVTQERLYTDQKARTVSDYRIVLPDADDIDNRTKHAGSGYVSGLEFEQPTAEQMTISGTIKAAGEWVMASVYAADMTDLVVTGYTNLDGDAGEALQALAPAFDGETYSYGVGVDNTILTVRVTPTCAAADTIYVNEEEVATTADSDPIPLDVGLNYITVKVEEDDKLTRITSITVVRDAA